MKVAAAERKKENKYNILSGALIAFALCFTLFIYAPYELYVTNQLEFWFTAGQMLPYALGLFAAAFLAILLVLYIARRINEKLYNFGKRGLPCRAYLQLGAGQLLCVGPAAHGRQARGLGQLSR